MKELFNYILKSFIISTYKYTYFNKKLNIRAYMMFKRQNIIQVVD